MKRLSLFQIGVIALALDRCTSLVEKCHAAALDQDDLPLAESLRGVTSAIATVLDRLQDRIVERNKVRASA